MSGLHPQHPAAAALFDDFGRSIHLYPTERTARLECLKLARSGREHASAFEVVEMAKAFADFVLGTAPAEAEPFNLKAEDRKASAAKTDMAALHHFSVSTRFAPDTEKAKAPESPALDPEVQASIQGWSKFGFASLHRALKDRHMAVDIVTGADGSWIIGVGGSVNGNYRSTQIAGRYPHDQVSTVISALADRWPSFTIPEPPAP